MIATELTGRVCVAMEIDPRYCDATIERWQRLTGATAVLAGEDRVFADVAAMRGVRAAARSGDQDGRRPSEMWIARWTTSSSVSPGRRIAWMLSKTCCSIGTSQVPSAWRCPVDRNVPMVMLAMVLYVASVRRISGIGTSITARTIPRRDGPFALGRRAAKLSA
jgi:hypothetical protein